MSHLVSFLSSCLLITPWGYLIGPQHIFPAISGLLSKMRQSCPFQACFSQCARRLHRSWMRIPPGQRGGSGEPDSPPPAAVPSLSRLSRGPHREDRATQGFKESNGSFSLLVREAEKLPGRCWGIRSLGKMFTILLCPLRRRGRRVGWENRGCSTARPLALQKRVIKTKVFNFSEA